MKLQHLIAASLLALATTGVHAASTLSTGGTFVMLNSGETGNIHRGAVGRDFTDIWTLEVNEATGAADVRISFSDIAVDKIPMPGGGGFINFDITDLEATGTGGDATLSFDGEGDAWMFAGVLNNGSYQISVSGTISGSNGGVYQTAFSASPAPVPLPPAAFLFGSALAAFAFMRRKKDSAPAV